MTPLRIQVRELLSSYSVAGSEEPALARMRRLLEAPGRVFASTHYSPGHFTASGVVTPPDFSEVVLIDHIKIGKWLQPGGHFEPIDATPVDAARREIEEECGITRLDAHGLIDIDVHDIDKRQTQPAHAHFDLRFLFTTDQRDLQALDGVVGARWVGVHETVERLGSTVQHLLDKVARYRPQA